MNYYESQLNDLQPTEYGYTIKLSDGNGYATKNMNLNSESIAALREFLNKIEKDVSND